MVHGGRETAGGGGKGAAPKKPPTNPKHDERFRSAYQSRSSVKRKPTEPVPQKEPTSGSRKNLVRQTKTRRNKQREWKERKGRGGLEGKHLYTGLLLQADA